MVGNHSVKIEMAQAWPTDAFTNPLLRRATGSVFGAIAVVEWLVALSETARLEMVTPKTERPAASLWIAAFLDILGYRAVLQGLDVFPLPDDPTRVNAAFGSARRFRRRLLGSLDVFLQGQEDEFSGHGSLDEQALSLVQGRKRLQVISSPGPDHMILASSLAEGPEFLPLFGVYTVLFASASAALIQLASGADDPTDTLPLRGGIDIAAGVFDHDENYLYSAAVKRAYEIESSEAVFPRIVVGERVRVYLEVMADEKSGSTSEERAMSNNVLQMVTRDRDGRLILDFYGEGFRQRLGGGEHACKLAKDAWEYVCGAEAMAIEKGTQHVIDKYRWLLQYMDERRSGWGF